jgi:hypothetical protein
MGLLKGGHGGGVFALAAIALVVSVILVLVAGRKDDDRAQTRTQARYLGVITLVSLFVALFAFFGVVRSLTNLIPGEERSSVTIPGLPPELEGLDVEELIEDLPFDIPGLDQSGPTYDDRQLQKTIEFGLLFFAAITVFAFHDRRARKLVPAENFPGDATGRIARAALYGACAVAALLTLFAAAKGIYGFFRIIIPGVTGDNSDFEREKGVAQLISFGLLAGASAFIFLRAWFWLPEHRDSK